MMDQHGTRVPARVLVVDDSAFMRSALSRMIASEGSFEVVGTAYDGCDALEKIAALDPDVITLDLEMPRLDGLATLRGIMNRFPRPVIMVSAATEQGAHATFNALSAGAFDYVPKQMAATSLDIDHIRSELIAKIRAAVLARRQRSAGWNFRKPVQSSGRRIRSGLPFSPVIVAMGASTGGPRALEEILSRLPKDLSVPILIVQHMPLGFSAPFAQRLDKLCAIAVREATNGEVIQPGIAYLAPSGLHMRVVRRTENLCVTISLDPDPGDGLHVPSIDVLMKSVAEVYRDRAMGVILTGMGSDGAEGMRAIHLSGGLTLGQDEASCTVYGMPRACAQLGVLSQIVPLSEISPQILRATLQRKHA